MLVFKLFGYMDIATSDTLIYLMDRVDWLQAYKPTNLP